VSKGADETRPTPEAIEAALGRARAFAAMQDDALARTRLVVALGEDSPDALRRWLTEPAGSVDALHVLVLLDEARALGSPDAERAVRTLEAEQLEDGSWAPEPGAGEEARIAATGLAAGLLARTVCARPAPLRRAGDFLAARFRPERVQDGRFGLLSAYACWLANARPDLADAGLQWCGREWERGLRSGRLAPASAARVLVLCDAVTLPGARVAHEDLLRSLLSTQCDDGGWLAEGPTPDRVDATAAAVRVLRRPLAGPRAPRHVDPS
jgi:hypothetical protein